MSNACPVLPPSDPSIFRTLPDAGWYSQWKAALLAADRATLATLLEIGVEWLLARTDAPAWGYVWQTVYDHRRDFLTAAQVSTLLERAIAWLETPVTPRIWSLVWESVWQAEGPLRPRLLALAEARLTQVRMAGWSFVWRILYWHAPARRKEVLALGRRHVYAGPDVTEPGAHPDVRSGLWVLDHLADRGQLDPELRAVAWAWIAAAPDGALGLRCTKVCLAQDPLHPAAARLVARVAATHARGASLTVTESLLWFVAELPHAPAPLVTMAREALGMVAQEDEALWHRVRASRYKHTSLDVVLDRVSPPRARLDGRLDIEVQPPDGATFATFAGWPGAPVQVVVTALDERTGHVRARLERILDVRKASAALGRDTSRTALVLERRSRGLRVWVDGAQGEVPSALFPDLQIPATMQAGTTLRVRLCNLRRNDLEFAPVDTG